jgi:hypothetical protein
MAKTSYIEISPDQEALYFAGLQQGDRFNFGKIIHKTSPFVKKRVANLTQRSLLPQVAALWNALSSADKTAWTLAGGQCGLNGYRLFVQDTCARLQYNLDGVSTPSLFFQNKVGHISINSPATLASICQLHPLSYWVLKKVPGSKLMYEPVNVKESFTLPLEIKLNYKSNLVSCGPDSYSKFYARIWYRYQALDLYYYLEIPLDFITDWKSSTNLVNLITGQVVGYDLFFTIYNLRGDLYFDNVKANHSGQNWVRDSYCNNISQTFSKIFYQIPKHWSAVELPPGSDYCSVPHFLI